MSESYIRGSWPRKCGHCSKFLEKSAYYTHRRSYFDRYGYWVDENGKRAVQSGKADIFEQRPDDVVIHYNDNGEPLSETKSLQKEFEESDLSDLCTSESDQDDGSMGGTVNNKCVSSDDDSCKAFNEESEYEDANEVEDNTEVWKDDDISEVAELNESVDETNTEEHDDIHIQHSSLMTAMFLFILLWQKIYNVSDRGIQRLVTFLKLLLATIAMVFKVDSLVNFSKNLPSTLYTIRKFLRLNRDDFTQYVVCVTCHSIYQFENCYKTLSTGKKVSLKCSHIEFPQHPHRSKRRPCGEALLKKVKGQNGQEYLYPKKVYCYRKLITSLKTFVTRPGFVDACNKWKTRNSQDNYMGDIYDGQVWKDFESQGYFKSKFNLCLTLNVDWFQPYEHTPHSVGALYLVINNLPRQERFMPENLILVGLLPGPNEPKKNINSYLEPLVNELQELAVGVKMKDNSKLGNIYRALLMCIASDIPATRKCGGFVGHGAFRGCSKCLQTFSREAFGEKADYSDFHVEDYPIRSDMDHKSYAYQCLNAKTPAEQAVTEREYGARWTQLNFLNYFQPVRFHVVDPMHNLLLGTAKHVIKTWKELKIINDEKMATIQDRVDSIRVPTNIGRIPNKIASGFSGFTADQWKNWVCVFSSFALKDVIPGEHFECWQLFVEACRLICVRKISFEDMNKAHELLIDFCKTFTSLYGKDKCTMNMHLHMHLMESISNFGPVYGFWCFSFERFNGILGSYPNNNHSITVQLMRKFLQGQQVSDASFPREFSEMQKLLDYDRCRGTLSETHVKEPDHSVYLNCTTDDISICTFTEDLNVATLPPVCTYDFDEYDASSLHEMYAKLYPLHHCVVLQLAECYKRVKFFNNVYCTNYSRGETSSCIYAKWVGDEYLNGALQIDMGAQPRPGIITKIVRSEVMLCDSANKRQRKSHIVAQVLWFKKHPMHAYYGIHAQVWGTDFESVEGASFIPIQRLMGYCISVRHKIKFNYCRSQGEHVTVIVPLAPVHQ